MTAPAPAQKPVAMPPRGLEVLRAMAAQRQQLDAQLQQQLSVLAEALGVPDGWGFDLQAGQFTPPPDAE